VGSELLDPAGALPATVAEGPGTARPVEMFAAAKAAVERALQFVGDQRGREGFLPNLDSNLLTEIAGNLAVTAGPPSQWSLLLRITVRAKIHLAVEFEIAVHHGTVSTGVSKLSWIGQLK